jgi:hypothetical protein
MVHAAGGVRIVDEVQTGLCRTIWQLQSQILACCADGAGGWWRVHSRRGADWLWPDRHQLLGLPEPGSCPRHRHHGQGETSIGFAQSLGDYACGPCCSPHTVAGVRQGFQRVAGTALMAHSTSSTRKGGAQATGENQRLTYRGCAGKTGVTITCGYAGHWQWLAAGGSSDYARDRGYACAAPALQHIRRKPRLLRGRSCCAPGGR